MRLNRVYVDAPLASGARVELTGSAATHVSRVLRLRAGEPLTVFNGRGGQYAAQLEAVRGGSVTVRVGEPDARERESPLVLRLVQGISRGERMDLVVQKATELGVAEILPVITERSVVRLDGAQAQRRGEHWRAIAVAACEQSGRNRVPGVGVVEPLQEFLRADEAPSTRLLLSPSATLRLAQVPPPAGAVTVLIGPEGGLTPQEQESAQARGYVGVRMGPRVLRTETAAIVALTLLQREFGDL
ncbi:MAG: 16S rRNA (uracil(1498)-N(3))-methyltransferase [Proteobacteria bacterium]|nr:16S rRNA (uracil(1498)-N(3))-methyltransferase [Pseudomonadota bacterium]